MSPFNQTQSPEEPYYHVSSSPKIPVVDWKIDFPVENFIDYGSLSLSHQTTDQINGILQTSKKITKVPSTFARRSKRARNPWTPQEDDKLMELMKKYGQSWAMISSQLVGRTGKQVRDRYLNKLRPNIKCGDWSAEEDNLFVELLGKIGNKWSLIAKSLPGRTEGQVKNRYYSSIKKRLQPDGTLCPLVDSNKSSAEEITSFSISPQEEMNFEDYTPSTTVSCIGEPRFIGGNFGMMKGYYNPKDELCSDQSTTQDSNDQSRFNSPVRINLGDPTDVISYNNTSEFLNTRQPAACNHFRIEPIQCDHQVDEMLGKVTNYFAENSNKNSEIDGYFNQIADASNDGERQDRLAQLHLRKAYLELALANIVEEINGI